MNIAVIQPAENLPPRRAFTAEDIRRMIEAGVIGEEERFELIEGEIVMMASKSAAHDNVQNALNLALSRAVPDGVYVGNGSTLQLAADVLVEPDLASFRVPSIRSIQEFVQPQAEDILLIIEIAVTSMTYDRKVKARSLCAPWYPRVLGH